MSDAEKVHALEIILSNWGDFPDDAERNRKTLKEIDKIINPPWYAKEEM